MLYYLWFGEMLCSAATRQALPFLSLGQAEPRVLPTAAAALEPARGLLECVILLALPGLPHGLSGPSAVLPQLHLPESSQHGECPQHLPAIPAQG